MNQAQTQPAALPMQTAAAPAAIELRHLRYFVALADAGSFTHAAERMFIAQPTLSQQIRRLEEIVGAPLLQRRREGLRLTAAGTVLLGASRNVLSLVDHEVSRTRQAAGLGRPRLRVVVPPRLPDGLAVRAASALRSAAAAVGVEVAWMEAPLDAEFSMIAQRRADAGLGWLTTKPEALPAPLDAMVLGDFEPEVWVPAPHAAARRGRISLEELAGMAVIHGPRRAEAGTYDAWAETLRSVNPRFEFTDPPFRHSLPMALVLAAAADRPTALLTGPAVVAGTTAMTPMISPGVVRLPRAAATHGMVRTSLDQHALTATAALVWNGDLPRPLQQILFETADGITPELAAIGLLVQVSAPRRTSGIHWCRVSGLPGSRRPSRPGRCLAWDELPATTATVSPGWASRVFPAAASSTSATAPWPRSLPMTSYLIPPRRTYRRPIAKANGRIAGLPGDG